MLWQPWVTLLQKLGSLTDFSPTGSHSWIPSQQKEPRNKDKVIKNPTCTALPLHVLQLDEVYIYTSTKLFLNFFSKSLWPIPK